MFLLVVMPMRDEEVLCDVLNLLLLSSSVEINILHNHYFMFNCIQTLNPNNLEYTTNKPPAVTGRYLYSQGVTDVMFENQPSLSLTSNGAEVIMIAKSFFNQYTTDATLRKLRTSVRQKHLDYKLVVHSTFRTWNIVQYNVCLKSSNNLVEESMILKLLRTAHSLLIIIFII